jgi:transcriptional regulator with XRE-family HTH domain
MGVTLSLESTPEVFQTPADWERWRQGMTPSGGNAHRALEPLKDAAPSGSEGGYLEHLVRGGLAFGLVMAAAAVTPTGGSSARAPADMVPVVTSGPAVAPRRRDDETPVERPAAPTLLAHVPDPIRHGAATATEAASRTASVAAITAEDQIAAIQGGLSLSVTQLAEILGVARGTVYGWMRGEVELPRDHGIAQRLRDLHRVARDWRARSDEELGRLAAAPLGDDQLSLVDLLAADSWDDAAIERGLNALADRLEVRSHDRRQAREHGVGRARLVTPETVDLERLRLRGLA